MNEYSFSVIIPAHNEEKYIGKCLRCKCCEICKTGQS